MELSRVCLPPHPLSPPRPPGSILYVLLFKAYPVSGGASGISDTAPLAPLPACRHFWLGRWAALAAGAVVELPRVSPVHVA